MKQISIGKTKIGYGCPVFVVAELSANHNQNYATAVKTIEAAKKAGADAIKLQTYTADSLTINCKNKHFQIRSGTAWDGKTLYELYQEAYTPWNWQPKLAKITRDLGMEFFSTPFDKKSTDFLEKLNVNVYKIASFETNDTELVSYIASKGKPVIISTGISTYEEIKDAVNACKKVGNNKIILLKCTSSYPAPLSEVNLKTMSDMSKKFNTILGISDHTLGISVPIAATALGAKVIEKHFILDRKIGGPDSEFSLEPNEFFQMVNSIRDVEKALGKITYKISPKIKKSRIFKRSLFVVKDIKKNEVLTEQYIRSIRPGFGLAPKFLKNVIGKKAKKNLKRGQPLKKTMFS